LRVFFTGENYRPDLNVSDYAITFDYNDDPRHYRLPFYVLSPGIADLTLEKDPQAILASKTRFCNFIYSNPRCKIRNDFFHKLNQYKRVDAAGKLFNNIGAPLKAVHPGDRTWDTQQRGWRDEVKIQFQRQYKFTIAFENSSRAGYCTERLADALLANTIAIYWGDTQVARDLNTRAFINCHEYASLDDVIEVVKTLDTDDDLYKEYLAQPYITQHGIACSLNEDRFFDWLDNAINNPPRLLAGRRRLAGMASRLYMLKQRHWFLRKFGRLSRIWVLYRRI
jgi:hypothetical protein